MAAVVQTNTPAKVPAEASPWKPRLLWRGSLVLADGTALPGVAFVSTCQPYFASSPAAPSSSSHADGAQTKDASTMTREQEADVCLSIEMVRHAPLPILDVVSSSSGHDDPTSSVSFTYQIGTGMRAYIDPKCHSTVAYFERTFCYPSSEVSLSSLCLLRERYACILILLFLFSLLGASRHPALQLSCCLSKRRPSLCRPSVPQLPLPEHSPTTPFHRPTTPLSLQLRPCKQERRNLPSWVAGRRSQGLQHLNWCWDERLSRGRHGGGPH